MIKPKHTVIFNRTQWNILLACICPQILGIIPNRQFRKHSKMHKTGRLVWSVKPKQDLQSHQRHHINPYYKEVI